MFHKAGDGILICFDYESKTLRVGTDSPLIPGFIGTLREIASFETYEEWAASRFPSQVTNEQVEDMIIWFWIDMSAENVDAPRP